MKEIPLTNGGVTLIDDEDFELASTFRWGKKRTPAGYWYARSTTNPRVWLHRLISGASARDDVDHRNHDTLDNRRQNLRVTTRSQNQQNRTGARRDSKTGVRGVIWLGNRKPPAYQAYANLDGRRYYFGFYQTLAEAEAAVLAGRARLMTHSDGR